MMGNTRSNRRQRGVTLIELAITATILTIVVGSIGMTMNTSFNLFSSSNSARAQDRKANRGMEKALDGLHRVPRGAILPQLALGETSSFISYQKVVGLKDGNPVFGPTVRIEWQIDPREKEDGLDNNENGLVDEGVVAIVVNPGEANEQRRIIARHVAAYMKGETPNDLDDNGNGLIDERGLSFELDGQILTIRMTVLRLGEDRRVVPQMVNSSVALR